MISQIYAAAKRHKTELLCDIYIPSVSGSTTESEKLGISPGYEITKNVPCIKSNRSRRREFLEGGERYVSTFSLLLHTDPAIDITNSSIVELLNRKYTILSFDHDLDKHYWKVSLRDE
jgi:hypothetical protein